MPKSKGRKARWVPPARNMLQMKITLKYIRPPIWRRIAVPDNASLGDLHWLIQVAMGWENSHLHAFRFGEKEYSSAMAVDEMGGEIQAEDSVLLGGLIERQGQQFIYEYDFGDDWLHEVVVEKIEPATDPHPPAVCLAGRRACPPEDCGGVPGYDNLLEALKAPTVPSNADLLEWLGGDYDPEYFDQEAINRILRRL